MKKPLIKGLCALAGTLLGLAVAEVTLRALDVAPPHRHSLRGLHDGHPRLGWVGRSGYEARLSSPDFDVPVVFDEAGFRRPGVPFDGPQDAPRIAFLGDSFTWGWGVGQGQVFTDRLQAELGDAQEVRNYGISGYGSAQQLVLLEELLLPQEPRTVVLMFFANDVADTIDSKDERRPWVEVVDDRPELRNLPVERPLKSGLRSLTGRSVALTHLRFFANVIGDRIKGTHRIQAAAPVADTPSPRPRHPPVGTLAGRCSRR